MENSNTTLNRLEARNGFPGGLGAKPSASKKRLQVRSPVRGLFGIGDATCDTCPPKKMASKQLRKNQKNLKTTSEKNKDKHPQNTKTIKSKIQFILLMTTILLQTACSTSYKHRKIVYKNIEKQNKVLKNLIEYRQGGDIQADISKSSNLVDAENLLNQSIFAVLKSNKEIMKTIRKDKRKEQ